MEDDDLELLRLAALKSVNSKKIQNKEQVGVAIRVVESINPVASVKNPYFPAVHPHVQTGSRIQTLVSPKNDNLPLSEPFVPHVAPPWNPAVESDYVAMYPGPLQNIQLSPRSAAFVSQNNDILNRRKVGVASPPERNRSRSPVSPPHRYTPGRWSKSVSPPLYKNQNSRFANYSYRSGSRSPINRDKSPLARKSRSPPPVKSRKSPFRKSLSASPHRIANERHLSPNYSRNRSPISRHLNNHKPYKHYSPSQSRPYNRKQLHTKRSPSPRSSHNGHHTVKRSRSPVNSLRRSRSKSPGRSFSHRPTRTERTAPNNKRRSPVPSNRKINRSTRPRRKPTPPNRSPSPLKRKIEKSESVQQRIVDERKEMQTTERPKDGKMDNPSDKSNDEPTADLEVENKSKELNENELLPSSNDDKSSDENEDDGIDLFASEESESENEGRFKSNSSKNGRSTAVTTVSFTKLGNSTSSALSNLNEMKSDKISTSSQRDRAEDRYKRSSNYSRRDDRGSKKYGSSRSEDSRYSSNYKSKYVSSIASVVPKVDDNKKDDKLMFKPTFQVLLAELKSETAKTTHKPTISSRISPVKEKLGDKKLVVLKRSIEPITDDRIEEETERLPSTGDNATKKPVHLRLGAPTKTWKNKKSWRTEKKTLCKNIAILKLEKVTTSS